MEEQTSSQNPQVTQKPKENIGFLSRIVGTPPKPKKDDDTVIDVRVKNPLKKIIKLLEDIKKQKAFSFTLKGSLGIMGVALALSLFGVFGGSKLLCDKGIQSEIGTIKVLNVYEQDLPQIPVITGIISIYNYLMGTERYHKRTVLIQQDQNVVQIPYHSNVDLEDFNNQTIIATGHYDSCSQILKVSNNASMETYLLQ